ncbi:hypothetical protein NMY22_g9656 [Coprinellus aureogranulatus]|nr:hypothetical protein NMY22_g9656 [Coprinellus aureogranulatus]
MRDRTQRDENGNPAGLISLVPPPIRKTQSHLPPELNSAIASFCSLKSLRNLALANRELQVHAERSLYESIIIRTSKKQVSALGTLVQSPVKVAYVRYLSLEFDYEIRSSDSVVVETILQAIPTVAGLKDLRVRLRQDLRGYASQLTDALCAGSSKLHTLYTSDWLDLLKVVQHQEELAFLGLYTSDLHRTPVQLLSSLVNRNIAVVGVSRFTYDPHYNAIVLAPDPLNPSQAESFGPLLRASFEMDRMSLIKLDPKHIESVTILLSNNLDQESFEAFLQSLAKVLDNLEELKLLFQSGDGVVHPRGLDRASWPSLTSVKFYSRTIEAAESLRVSSDWAWTHSRPALEIYIGKWRAACPNLRRVTLGDEWIASMDLGWRLEALGAWLDPSALWLGGCMQYHPTGGLYTADPGLLKATAHLKLANGEADKAALVGAVKGTLSRLRQGSRVSAPETWKGYAECLDFSDKAIEQLRLEGYIDGEESPRFITFGRKLRKQMRGLLRTMGGRG